MLEELEKEIQLSEEVLNNLPVNNVKNMKKFIKEIDAEIDNYKTKALDISKELESRIKKFEGIKYEEESTNDALLEKLKKALIYTNNLSTSYEKLDFDKIVYRLSHYQEGDLIDNNRNILKAIHIFKTSSVNLTLNDFDYTKFVNEYMTMFFEDNLTTSKVKDTFDNIYWQCPDIMLQIELNLRHLCNKYSSKTEAYIKDINKQIDLRLVNSSNTILDDYNYLRLQDSNHINRNNLIFDFYNQKIDIDEYTDEKIEAIIASLFSSGDYDDSKIELIKQLKNSLVEYKYYLNYKDLIDKIKQLYNETLEKDFMAKNNKKIKDLEHKLFKLNKKFTSKFKKTSVDKNEPIINSTIHEIKELYNEIDSNIFKVVIKEHIKDNSTIFKSLLLLCQYYVILAEYFKEKNPEINYLSIDEEIDKLYDFIMNPNNTVINNVTILEEKDLSDIIVTNYKMLNINIDQSLISEDSIDGLISDLEKIIMNYNLKMLKISIDELQDAKLIKLTLDKNNVM